MADIAAAYGVTVRTVYRYLEGADELVQDVVVAGWHATFAVTPGGQPRRVARWRRA